MYILKNQWKCCLTVQRYSVTVLQSVFSRILWILKIYRKWKGIINFLPSTFLFTYLYIIQNSGNYNDDHRIYHPQVLKLQTRQQTPAIGGCRPQAIGGGNYSTSSFSSSITSPSLNRTPSAPEMACPPKSCLSRRHHNDTCNKSLDANRYVGCFQLKMHFTLCLLSNLLNQVIFRLLSALFQSYF